MNPGFPIASVWLEAVNVCSVRVGGGLRGGNVCAEVRKRPDAAAQRLRALWKRPAAGANRPLGGGKRLRGLCKRLFPAGKRLFASCK